MNITTTIYVPIRGSGRRASGNRHGENGGDRREWGRGQETLKTGDEGNGGGVNFYRGGFDSQYSLPPMRTVSQSGPTKAWQIDGECKNCTMCSGIELRLKLGMRTKLTKERKSCTDKRKLVWLQSHD
jgi:hypothetical protein